jgi:hypothetical protein
LAQAHKHLHEAVTIAAAFHHQEMLGLLQPFLGLATLYQGDVSAARRLLLENLRLCTELKDKGLLARVCTYLTEVALWEGEVDRAAQWLAQSLDYHTRPRRITIYTVERLFVAARLATAQQQYQRAATLFGLAEAVGRQLHAVPAAPMESLVETALAAVREALEPADFAEAFAAGQQMSLEEAYATILATSHSASSLATAAQN